MRDDIFEEDLFGDEDAPVSSPVHSDDEDTQYVIDLMNEALELCEGAVKSIDNLIEVNEKFGEDITGIATSSLQAVRTTYEKVLPDLILDENTDDLVDVTQKVLSTTRKVAEEYISSKRMTILENMDKNNKK